MVELIPDPRELSLSMREADVSVRLAAPTSIPSASIHWVVHRDNRATARIRAVLTQVTKYFYHRAAELFPVDAKPVTRPDVPDNS